MPEWQIKVLMQRYTVDQEPKFSIVKKNPYQAHQKVFYLGLVKDFGLRNKGQEFHLHKKSRVAQVLVKHLNLRVPEDPSFQRYLSKYSSGQKIRLGEILSICR